MPDGASLPIQSDALLAHMAESYGGPVHLVQANRGTFDGQGLSFVTSSTLRAMQEHVGIPLDAGRFRINIVIELHRDPPSRRTAGASGCCCSATARIRRAQG